MTFFGVPFSAKSALQGEKESSFAIIVAKDDRAAAFYQSSGFALIPGESRRLRATNGQKRTKLVTTMITGAQLRMARGYLRWSAKELADKAGVAESTIKRMEQDEGFPVARGANIEAVYKALAEAGIIFVPENGGGVGIRLRKDPGPIGNEQISVSKPSASPRPSRKKPR
jgi:DNA-binding XRE family transcriptional regulator